ncbi:hypothetical protein SI65_00955 [Aspergillus cristatus]|uniref:Glycoside hydrolase family 5 domain-containing protein n=1 Tax=Aspergillus cristatus TaxID=573508 RepID=A0A1E3BSM2_ASPCR|nr:hypothetical protein SI65_00955 [Aspergillus cristatus]
MIIAPPSPQDILLYRYQHATNLGSVFVLERWLRNSMYDDDTPGSSEIEAIKRSLQVRGLYESRAKWETLWLTALSDDDLHWLKHTTRCNSIRLPIGYFTLGPAFCIGTDFDGEPGQHLIEKCYAHGIGVLIDFHAVPGGANSEGHSVTDTGRADFWRNEHYRALARDCIAFVIQEVKFHALHGVIGIELCNEAAWDPPGMHEWYDEVIEVASAIDSSIPIYVSDAWNLSAALDYAMGKNNTTLPFDRSPVIVDTHKYYCFTEDDRNMHPNAIRERVANELGELAERQGNVFDRKSAVEVYIGEYSCAMDQHTFDHADPSQRPELTVAFGNEQSRTWSSKASGSAFWTFKMDWMDGGDWGFKEQVNTGAIPAPPWLALSRDEVHARLRQADIQRNDRHEEAYSQHIGYWDSVAPGVHFEHDRYSRGWDLGYADAGWYFGALVNSIIPGQREGGEKIGALDLWVRKRITETNEVNQGMGWKWEHGFRKVINDFYSVVGV